MVAERGEAALSAFVGGWVVVAEHTSAVAVVVAQGAAGDRLAERGAGVGVGLTLSLCGGVDCFDRAALVGDPGFLAGPARWCCAGRLMGFAAVLAPARRVGVLAPAAKLTLRRDPLLVVFEGGAVARVW